MRVENKPAGIWKGGDPFVWMTGGALVFSLLMIAGLLVLIVMKGLGFFWPSDLVKVRLQDERLYLGQQTGRERIPQPGAPQDGEQSRIQLKIANRDLYGLDFVWLDESAIRSREHPEEAILIERREWGNFHGFVKELRSGEAVIADEAETAWRASLSHLPEIHGIYRRIRKIEVADIGRVNHRLAQLEGRLRELEEGEASLSPANQREVAALEKEILEEKIRYEDLEGELAELYKGLKRYDLVLETVDGRERVISLGGIVRLYRPNSLSTGEKVRLYLSKLWEFVSGYPRESNTEGGVFPAIFGTVMMVLIMTVAVMPFGVIAAVYLREYARQGPLVRLVRISVNNLAGVPSIVFGIFGLGFFIYGIGGAMDRTFFSDALPTPTFGTGGIFWASLTLALLTLPVVIVSAEEGLAAVPQDIRHGSLALGANKFETLIRVVLPSAAPGMFTGLILAIARATGEVAPLMITGVVKLAPALPIDGIFPYIHLERKFMHLGFHIYDVGFQSPNVEAAKPMVYTTTLLLILIVVVLNLGAIAIRNHLRRKYASAVF